MNSGNMAKTKSVSWVFSLGGDENILTFVLNNVEN